MQDGGKVTLCMKGSAANPRESAPMACYSENWRQPRVQNTEQGSNARGWPYVAAPAAAKGDRSWHAAGPSVLGDSHASTPRKMSGRKQATVSTTGTGQGVELRGDFSSFLFALKTEKKREQIISFTICFYNVIDKAIFILQNRERNPQSDELFGVP